MFSEDELHQARAVSVLEIAERHCAKLRKSGREFVGPCPVCGGREDKFAIKPSENVWHCRGLGAGGGAIDLEMHLNGCSFPDAVRALIGKDAGTPQRRQPTPEQIAARQAREAEQLREEAEEQARNESSAAKILARLQPVIGTPGEAYLRDLRKIDVNHWAVRQALMDVETLGWCERTCFHQADSNEPFHELHGQWLGAIVAILTDPVTAEPTGGITRTFIHQGRKVGKAMSLGGAGRPGIIRLSPDDEALTGLHLCEGLESALSAMMGGFLPCWATGSAGTMAKLPVLNGIECLTILADNDSEKEDTGRKAAIKAAQRWRAAGREVQVLEPLEPGDLNDIVRRAR